MFTTSIDETRKKKRPYINVAKTRRSRRQHSAIPTSITWNCHFIPSHCSSLV